MSFTVDHECPQCGAPLELEETNRLLRCPYCHVKTFLFAHDHFRFVLPHKAPNQEILYAPYVRFKGTVYFCQGTSINHRIVDITHQGTTFTGLPLSLGVRPQAMKMRFVTPEVAGLFLSCSVKIADVLVDAGNRSSMIQSRLFHRAYIGEAISLIYLPIFLQHDKIFDGVLNRPIGRVPNDVNAFVRVADDNDRWQIKCMATVCPHCGWNLDGEKDSVALMCSNCDTVWEASAGQFVQVKVGTVPGSGKTAVYLPFWKIGARADGVEINSYGDFIRVTRQPIVFHKHWDQQDMFFWLPAFKIRPRVFLRLSRQLTVTQQAFDVNEEIPRKKIHPVTLPRSEAAQSIKVTFASCAVTKRKIFPMLPRINFQMHRAMLVYLPFTDTGHDIVQEHTRVTIQKKTLEFGRHL